MSEKLLEIKDLHVQYNTDEATVFAVNGIELSIGYGETLGLVGETGAGKTTTGLSIMQLLPKYVGEITKGSIMLDGVDVMKAKKDALRKIRGSVVSMIFQDPMSSLNPVITVGDQIGEALMLHKFSKSKAEISDEVDRLLKMVNIPCDRKKEYPHQFSGGMKQRIVIAIALACKPKLIIADEPTTALDVTIQAQVLKLMDDLLKEQNTSILMITHDFGVVAETCDKVAVMYSGEIVEFGSLEDILADENHHPYTSGLFKSLPNLKEKTRRLNVIEGLMPDPTVKSVGCAFAPRCPKCMDICKEVKPDTILVKDTHGIKCHLYNQSSNN